MKNTRLGRASNEALNALPAAPADRFHFMTGKKFPRERFRGVRLLLDSRKRTQGTQRCVGHRGGHLFCVLCNLVRPMIRSRHDRVGFFALAALSISHSLLAQSPRLDVIHAMLERPNDPWPRGKGHVVLAVPGCSEASKGYHEPGGG